MVVCNVSSRHVPVHISPLTRSSNNGGCDFTSRRNKPFTAEETRPARRQQHQKRNNPPQFVAAKHSRVDTPSPPLPLPAAAVTTAAAAAALVTFFHPFHDAAHAAETIPDGFFEALIVGVESLGPAGPLAFILAVALAESVPLLPTQPLSLASGLLFGAQKGALCMLAGTTCAALLAFSLARGLGRPLAERIIRAEMAHEGGDDEEGEEKSGGGVRDRLMHVTEAIEKGSFKQQFAAVALLRLTPIIPFSASNYVLGLSPLPLTPYLLGTMTGMSGWCAFYASLGGASRSLLKRGVDPDALLSQMLAKVANLTEEVGAVTVVACGAAALAYGAAMLWRPQWMREDP